MPIRYGADSVAGYEVWADNFGDEDRDQGDVLYATPDGRLLSPFHAGEEPMELPS